MSIEQSSVKPEGLTTLSTDNLSKLESVRVQILRDPQHVDLVPFSKDQLKFPANGIELRREHSGFFLKEGDYFENKCFSRILSKPGQSVVIGPCLIDVLLSQRFTEKDAKPDAISFDTSQKSKWTLTELYEFKTSKKSRQVTDKLFGLSQLLEKLRENPEYFPRLLDHALRRLVEVPQIIEIPEDRQVTAILVYPSKGPIKEKPQTFFQLRYLRVPN